MIARAIGTSDFWTHWLGAGANIGSVAQAAVAPERLFV